MSKKSHLVLIELMIMLLIFSITAALCLQVFAWSSDETENIENRDKAMLKAQTAAEIIKAFGGDFAEAAEELGGVYSAADDALVVCYTGDWECSEAGTADVAVDAGGNGDAAAEKDAYWQFRLTAKRDSDSDGALLERAEISMESRDGEMLFQIPVCWQKVM